MTFLIILNLIFLFMINGNLYLIRKKLFKINLIFTTNGKINKGEKMDLKVNDTVAVAAVLEDKFGNVTSAGLDAIPTWGLADTTLGSVTASDDGLSCVVTPNGKLGVTQLQFAAMIEGKQLLGSLDLNLVAGDAAQVVLQPGVPVSQ